MPGHNTVRVRLEYGSPFPTAAQSHLRLPAPETIGWDSSVVCSMFPRHLAFTKPLPLRSTTAKIINQYLPSASPTKMVDFSLFLAPDTAPISAANTAALQAIQSLRRVLPCNVINHTDFPPLRNRPIALSIETKRRGGGEQQEADLQIGIWHAAQWKFLSRLVSDAGGDLDTLPFLPAIIVRGHEWSFAATTREGQKTVLWLERNFGSTTSALGVYSIVWGLQRLAAWAEDVYWPWFKQNALGI